ncbi:MAG: hypothetical protein KGL39_22890, partial [Patescibacteria group bacterium]|nr:hypothetical protein [Patescibacteria group bacterium]
YSSGHWAEPNNIYWLMPNGNLTNTSAHILQLTNSAGLPVGRSFGTTLGDGHWLQATYKGVPYSMLYSNDPVSLSALPPSVISVNATNMPVLANGHPAPTAGQVPVFAGTNNADGTPALYPGIVSGSGSSQPRHYVTTIAATTLNAPRYGQPYGGIGFSSAFNSAATTVGHSMLISNALIVMNSASTNTFNLGGATNTLGAASGVTMFNVVVPANVYSASLFAPGTTYLVTTNQWFAWFVSNTGTSDGVTRNWTIEYDGWWQ